VIVRHSSRKGHTGQNIEESNPILESPYCAANNEQQRASKSAFP
jgi:hypothetical protein